MSYQNLGQILVSKLRMNMQNFIARLDPIRIQDSDVSLKSGEITYGIKGKNGNYNIVVLYPKDWDTKAFEGFAGRKSSQIFFEERGDDIPQASVHLGPEYVKRYFPIWHIVIYFTFSYGENVIVSTEMMEDMLNLLADEFIRNLK